MHRYYYKQNAVSEKDCDDFLKSCEESNFTNGKVDIETAVKYKKDRRISKVFALNGHHLFSRLIWSYILEFNVKFQLAISGYEAPQVTKYDEVDAHYCWHKDVSHINDNIIQRKLSAVLQLSKSENYKGAELQLFDGEDVPEKLPIQNQGDLIVFRSDEWHRVTPLIEGERLSIVFWATGDRLI
jgi:predicted 2-oxoglutarate/Fe(II)-dependent dioxygenase YbiX